MNIPRSKTGPNTNFGRDCDTLLSGVYDLLIYDQDSNGIIEYTGVAVTKQNIVYNNPMETVTTTATTSITAKITASSSDIKSTTVIFDNNERTGIMFLLF